MLAPSCSPSGERSCSNSLFGWPRAPTASNAGDSTREGRVGTDAVVVRRRPGQARTRDQRLRSQHGTPALDREAMRSVSALASRSGSTFLRRAMASWLPGRRAGETCGEMRHSEMSANLLIGWRSNFSDFSERALINNGNHLDFDSAIPRFESWRPSQESTG
jgi:hypothetical protein